MFDIATIYKKQVEEIDTQIKNELMRVAITWGIDVNEEKLIKALTDARAFYDEGYEDGQRDAIDGLVRCKDCKHYGMTACGNMCKFWEDWIPTEDDDFCSYRERKDGEV